MEEAQADVYCVNPREKKSMVSNSWMEVWWLLFLSQIGKLMRITLNLLQ